MSDQQGPVPYGAVVHNGSLYPETYCNDMTRFEADFLNATINNASLIIKVLRCTDNHELADRIEHLYLELEAEGGVDYWVAHAVE